MDEPAGVLSGAVAEGCIHKRDDEPPPDRGGRVHSSHLGVVLMKRVATVALTIALAGCWVDAKPKRATPMKQPVARVEATLELPNGDGRVHIVAMPTDLFESARCLVAVGPNAQAAVSCAPKGLDMPPDTQDER